MSGPDTTEPAPPGAVPGTDTGAVTDGPVPALLAHARRHLDPAVLAYYEGGAGAQTTRDEAEDAWRRYRLLPRVLTDVAAVDTRVTLPGAPAAPVTPRTPFLVGPTALHGLAHPDGEVATARGAAAAGALMTVSASAGTPLEEVAAACAGPWWCQLYVRRCPDIHRGLAERARDAGATALVLTADMPVHTRKPGADITGVPGVAEMLGVNDLRHLPADAAPDARRQSPATTPAAIGELATLTGLPVLVKGVLRADDARRVVDAGAAGIVVSNHGGRQLDRAVSTAEALPAVVAAVGDRVPVLVDGGVRRGVDALVALALGARAVLLGRPVLWALAAGGADGVRDLLDALGAELAEAMALAGAPRLDAVTRDLVTA